MSEDLKGISTFQNEILIFTESLEWLGSNMHNLKTGKKRTPLSIQIAPVYNTNHKNDENQDI